MVVLVVRRPARAVLATDGAGASEARRGGFGCVYAVHGRTAKGWKLAGPLGEQTTGNEAEYFALVRGLQGVVQKGGPAEHLTVRMDSELVVKQMNGEYAVKDEKLKVYHALANALVARIDAEVEFVHVRREENAEADALARRGAECTGEELGQCVEGFAVSLCDTGAVNIQGVPRTISATTDLGAFAAAGLPVSIIDAAFMAEALPGEFARIKQCEQTVLFCKHGDQNIIGKVDRPLRLRWSVGDSAMTDLHEHAQVLVVAGLPVPFHVTTQLRRGSGWTSGAGLEARNFPEKYRVHPYWTTSNGVISAPSEHGRIRILRCMRG